MSVEIADYWTSRGWPVLQVHTVRDGRCTCGNAECGSPGKHPANFNGVHGARLDAPADWWSEPRNVGLAVPPGFVVVDIDPRNGGSVEGLDLPPTFTVRTGGGGEHYYYACDPALRWPKELRRGVDLRRKGHYVIAPGSVTAGAYVVTQDAPIARAPSAFITGVVPQAAAPQAQPQAPAGVRRLTAGELEALVSAFVPACVPGQRHALALGLGGWARQRGIAPEDLAALVARLPFRDRAARGLASRATYEAPTANGYHALRELGVPEALLDALPSPAGDLREAFAAAGRAEVVADALAPPGDDFGFGRVADLTVDPEPLAGPCASLELVPGKPSALVAYANGGKSPLAAQLALCVAAGAEFLGHATTAGRVCYLAPEGERLMRRRLIRLARGLGVAPDVDLRPGATLNEDGAAGRLRRLIDARGYDLVIVDTYGAALSGIDHNSNEFSDAMKQLERVSNDTGATVLALLHARKDAEPTLQAIAGHNSVAGAVQQAMALTRRGTEHELRFACVRSIERGFAPLDLVARDVARGDDAAWGLRFEIDPAAGIAGAIERRETAAEGSERCAAAIMLRLPLLVTGALVADPFSIGVSHGELYAAVQAPPDHFEAALKWLVKCGRILRRKSRGGGIFWTTV